MQFYLQDTKSSNGTFVNSHRLSKGSEESAPYELFSNDTVQFGVDVMENSRKGYYLQLTLCFFLNFLCRVLTRTPLDALISLPLLFSVVL